MKKGTAVDEKNEVPAYIVTFSDMITLLLTFFVMLLSLAEVQDPELMNKGRDSFVESLQHYGLGVFMGKNRRPGYQLNKEKHLVPEDDPNSPRNIDAENEVRRRAFKKLDKEMTTMPAQIGAARADFSHISGLSFKGTAAELDASSREALGQFIVNLRVSLAGQQGIVYILGLAQNAGNPQQCWVLASQRAQAVADVINQQLNSGRSRPLARVYAWGAGPGHDWAGRKGPIASDTQILVAVLKNR